MRSAFLFRFTGEFPPGLAEVLEDHVAQDPSKLQIQSSGFVPVSEGSLDELVVSIHGFQFMRYESRERVVPAAVIKAELNKRIKSYKSRVGHIPGRREKLRLKDEVLMDLLPQAFIKPSSGLICVDEARKLLYVCASSPAAADLVTKHIRVAIRELNLHTITDAESGIARVLTIWMSNAPPDKYIVRDHVKIKAERGASVTVNNADLESEGVQTMIRDELYEVSEIALSYGETLRFVLTSSMRMKRIAFGELLSAQLNDMDSQSDADDLRNTLYLWATGVGQTVEDLMRRLPGFEMAASDA